MAERYIEIFEERKENGRSELSYQGFDKKMHDVSESVKDAVTKMWEVMDTSVSGGAVPKPSWIGTTYTITNNLTNVTTDNPVVRIEAGKPYEAILTTSNSAKTVTLTTLTMGGTNKASTNASSVTGATNKKKISFDSVTGNIVITASQSS